MIWQCIDWVIAINFALLAIWYVSMTIAGVCSEAVQEWIESGCCRKIGNVYSWIVLIMILLWIVFRPVVGELL